LEQQVRNNVTQREVECGRKFKQESLEKTKATHITAEMLKED
jgi:hypothetical protein